MIIHTGDKLYLKQAQGNFTWSLFLSAINNVQLTKYISLMSIRFFSVLTILLLVAGAQAQQTIPYDGACDAFLSTTTRPVSSSCGFAPAQVPIANFTQTLNGATFEMIAVRGGTFQMGSPQNDPDRESNEAQHRVTVDDYYIGKHEVTLALFKMFVDATGYTTDAEKEGSCTVWKDNELKKQDGVNWRCDHVGNIRPEREYNHPVIYVSWNDAVAFCNWLSQQTGRQYRLPTESEWEFAARGCSRTLVTKYSGGNSVEAVGWSAINSGGTTHAVGTKRANEIGTHDMTGNVWEWCNDWYGSYPSKPTTNPQGPSTGSSRVTRGGGWIDGLTGNRVVNRNHNSPSNRGNDLGFRLACSAK